MPSSWSLTARIRLPCASSSTAPPPDWWTSPPARPCCRHPRSPRRRQPSKVARRASWCGCRRTPTRPSPSNEQTDPQDPQSIPRRRDHQGRRPPRRSVADDGLPGRERQLLCQRLHAGAVVGVVLPPPLCESAAVRAELNAARLPIVTVAAGRPPADTMCVRIDDYSAALEMTRYLLGLGHERVAFIKGHPNQSASEERWLGFTAALEEAARSGRGERPPLQMEQGFFSFRSGLDAARKLLA